MVLIFGVVIPLVQFIQDQVQSWLLQMNSITIKGKGGHGAKPHETIDQL